ncbi:DNA cytosine methyltransferase [Mucilaginibacter sp.]|jgi:DNA (cytosine-5)-methyltransferase 1|uniref:DNA cytosine methyltransferase n=1 Tax=Mucilaginibacter sp. TaxID=1882438 RepID=UPI0035639FCA
MIKYNSIDLFSGVGGLTEGMHQAGFETKLAIEIVEEAVIGYKLNHANATVLQKDIRAISKEEISTILNGERLHLLAGCPPCQGFSSIRRLNRGSVEDHRNDLVLEYLRLVKEHLPYTIMMENVPALKEYTLFEQLVSELREIGYHIDFDVVNVKDYGVPQRRRRLVMVGSLLGPIKIARGNNEKVTVREVIGNLESIQDTKDLIHTITAKHTDAILERIKLTPKNGGSSKDLPASFKLKCHQKDNVGFNDVYGRLRWDDYSTTITGGCLNPSKGRFLHPEENRVISPREAALLQSFPKDYKFPLNIPKQALALLIGNALPPKFSYIQSSNIKNHLDSYLGNKSESN